MQIRSGRFVCGVDAATLRSFFLNYPDDFTPDEFAMGTSMIRLAADSALACLESEGFVRTLNGGESYLIGENGMAVARAHPGGAYKRAFIRDQVIGLAMRITNTTQRASKNLFFPAKVAVFGSYMDTSVRTLGDLDLAIELRYLFDGEPDAVRRERTLHRAGELGRHFLPSEWRGAESFLRETTVAHLRGDAPWLDVEDYDAAMTWEPQEILTLVDVDAPDERGENHRHVLGLTQDGHRVRYGRAA